MYFIHAEFTYYLSKCSIIILSILFFQNTKHNKLYAILQKKDHNEIFIKRLVIYFKAKKPYNVGLARICV